MYDTSTRRRLESLFTRPENIPKPMKVFALADLHLSFAHPKPMSVFGEHWEAHEEAIATAWRADVDAEDLVLLPGDLSWAMRADEARADLAWIDALPGRKLFIQGNHDYWCGKTGKIRSELPPSLGYVRHEALVVGRAGVCGVRGWTRPDDEMFVEENDRKLWLRELGRMETALRALSELNWDVGIVMTHFPPRPIASASDMSRLIESAGVTHCVYGHLHGASLAEAFEGESGGVLYRCVSADHVAFRPVLIAELTGDEE